MSSNNIPKKNQIEISTLTGPTTDLKVGAFSQLQGKSLESTLALTGQIFQWPIHEISSYW
jgi:hypothetical protein